MNHRFLWLIAILGLVIVIVSLAAVPIAGQATKSPAPKAAKGGPLPKLPWGDPDLQGTWTSDDYIGVPLQRNPQFGDRLYLTDDEVAQREKQIQNQATTDLQEFALRTLV